MSLFLLLFRVVASEVFHRLLELAPVFVAHNSRHLPYSSAGGEDFAVDGVLREGYQLLEHLHEVDVAHFHVLDVLVEVLLQLDDLGNDVALWVVQHVIEMAAAVGHSPFASRTKEQPLTRFRASAFSPVYMPSSRWSCSVFGVRFSLNFTAT